MYLLMYSLKQSDEWGSETSSGILGRLRRLHITKKSTETQCKISTNGSEDGNDVGSQIASINQSNPNKQSLMSKLKPTVTSRLQAGVQSDNHGMHHHYLV